MVADMYIKHEYVASEYATKMITCNQMVRR